MWKICRTLIIVTLVSLVNLPVLNVSGAENEKSVATASDNYSELSAEIDRKRSELTKVERTITMKNQVLVNIENELNALLTEVESMSKEVQERCSKIQFEKKSQLEKMVKIYEVMSPEDSAARIMFLDKKTAIIILQMMKSKKVANVLSFMSPKDAAKMSKDMLN